MANRKGIKQVKKWGTSDGREFLTAKEANDHQGALNELAKWFDSFMARPDDAGLNLTDDPELIRGFIYQWELHKNSTDPATPLFPEDGVQSPDSESDTVAPEKQK